MDAVFSRLVRLSRADATGYVQCYTCDTVRHWKELQAGHYLSRRHHATRWHVNNVRPQCVGCNKYGRLHGPGESVIFRRQLIAEGVDVDELEQLARTVRQWSEDELEELLHEYRSYLTDLEQSDGKGRIEAG